MSKIVKGFSKFSKEEKINWLASNFFTDKDRGKKILSQYLNEDLKLQRLHDEFIENTISNFYVPYAIAPNFIINERPYTIPMAIEESSVVAAASLAAKFWSQRGGFRAEVISTTKYISGGATSFGGAIIDHGNYDWTNNPNLSKYLVKFGKNAFLAKIRKNIYRNTGGSMAPQTARFQIQGLDILELRVEKCYQNCLALGRYLRKNEKVKRVGYPGLQVDAGYHLSEKYFSGIPGTIMTFDLESKAACFVFMNKLQIIRRATNLNDNKSLIIHPYSTIYAEFSEEEREEAEIRATMMRLSVGIENLEDLIADIEQALG
jgi:O-acetylhomoserine (thiol)-lyase